MKKPRLTEEFLWQLHDLLETMHHSHKTFMPPRSWKDALSPEWRKLRFAYGKKKRKRSFVQFVSYLKRMGYIKIPAGESVGVLSLTVKGEKKALEGEKKARVLRPRKDGRMIMLMYDIPKRKEGVRQPFRDELEFLGYQLLQKSVWVSTKDVLEETERVVQKYGLDDCVKLFIIEKIRVIKK